MRFNERFLYDIGFTKADLATLRKLLSVSGNVGSLGLQESNAVSITGGAIDGAVIGAVTPAPGTFSFTKNVGLHQHSVQVGITANAGGGQGSAVVVNREINIVQTVAAAGDSVRLVEGKAGYRIMIMNHTANACDVYTKSGGDLGAGVNVPISLAAGANVTYQCWVTDLWESV